MRFFDEFDEGTPFARRAELGNLNVYEGLLNSRKLFASVNSACYYADTGSGIRIIHR
jgi:hypothetical protein